jgi:Kef-type K+ transport system membrane component KefB
MDNLIASVTGDIALVLIVSSLLSATARRCGQPAVVGQIIAGIAFGPSLLGRLPGHLTSTVFPPRALSYLTVISQVAVILFMFVVGYELSWTSAGRNCRRSLLVAVCSLTIPLALGSGSAMVFRPAFDSLGRPEPGGSFVLFMGVATSITALPVLAAIIRERDLSGTIAGLTATTAAGVMDVAAWILLATALAGTAHRHGTSSLLTLLMIVAFAAVMLLAVRPALAWWLRRPRAMLVSQLPLALALTFMSAWVTTSLGLHPIFGGLLAGFAMPRRNGMPDPDLLRPMEDVAGALLPLFFVVTGLSVNVTVLNGTALLLGLLLLAVASAGKIAPGYLASRMSGLEPKDSATVAALVNTRGLTELIALNAGLSAGLIGLHLFSALVLMAVITTLMTAPLLRLIRPVTVVAPAPPPDELATAVADDGDTRSGPAAISQTGECLSASRRSPKAARHDRD